MWKKAKPTYETDVKYFIYSGKNIDQVKKYFNDYDVEVVTKGGKLALSRYGKTQFHINKNDHICILEEMYGFQASVRTKILSKAEFICRFEVIDE